MCVWCVPVFFPIILSFYSIFVTLLQLQALVTDMAKPLYYWSVISGFLYFLGCLVMIDIHDAFAGVSQDLSLQHSSLRVLTKSGLLALLSVDLSKDTAGVLTKSRCKSGSCRCYIHCCLQAYYIHCLQAG